MEAAAAEADAVVLRLFADFFRELDKYGSKPGVEPATHVRYRFLTANIGEKRLEKRKRADLPVFAIGNQVEAIRSEIGGIVRGHFELDGGLGFVIHRGTDADERGDRVEKAATTRGARRVDLAIDHLLNEEPATLVDATEERQFQGVEILDVVLHQVAECDAPRFVDRGGPTGKRDVFEMCHTFEARVIGNEHFPSPDGAIGAIAGAIERDTDHSSVEMIFRHAGSDMRVMVLDTDQLNAFRFLSDCPLGGEIVRVKIVRDDLGLNFQDALHVLDGFFVEIVAFEIFKIADVLAEERFGATNNADRVFQFATDGENRFGFMFEGNGHRNKAARAAKHLEARDQGTNHRIIAAAENVPIVDEISVGDTLEAPDSFVVVDGDGFFAEIRTGHDKSVEFTAGEEKMV